MEADEAIADHEGTGANNVYEIQNRIPLWHTGTVGATDGKQSSTNDVVNLVIAIGGGRNKSDEWKVRKFENEWKIDDLPW